MPYEMKDHAHSLRIHHYKEETNEYWFSEDRDLPPGVGIPALSTHIAPPAEWDENKIPVFNVEKDAWEILEDYRAFELYDTQTGEQVQLHAIGPLPDTLTVKHPTGPLVKWSDGQWVEDEEAIKNLNTNQLFERKRVEMDYANQQIAILADAIDLGMATNDEQALYNKLRRFRVLLSRADPSNPPENWPELPAVHVVCEAE